MQHSIPRWLWISVAVVLVAGVVFFDTIVRRRQNPLATSGGSDKLTGLVTGFTQVGLQLFQYFRRSFPTRSTLIAEQRGYQWSQQPGPNRSLVIGTVPGRRISPIAALVVGIIGGQRAHTLWCKQFFHRIQDLSGLWGFQ